MAKTTVPPNRDARKIVSLLASPEVAALIADLQATRWTGRPGYPIRTMVGMALVKSLYVLPTWTPHGTPRGGARRPPDRHRRCSFG